MTSTDTSTIPALRLAGPEDIDTVAEIVTDAFDHLKVIHYLVPDPARRWAVAGDWYRLHVAHAINGAGQVVMSEDGSAAAVWFDRTREASEPEGYEKHLADLAGEYLPRFQHLDLQMELRHPSDPHWHLLFLAVRPERWSQGLGGRLMEHTHAGLDVDGIPAYLEATGVKNRALYRRHGYLDMNPPTIAVTGDTVLYRMSRPVRTTDTPSPSGPG